MKLMKDMSKDIWIRYSLSCYKISSFKSKYEKMKSHICAKRSKSEFTKSLNTTNNQICRKLINVWNVLDEKD